jgi:DNA-binding XRE family transcriptional regulator
MYRNDATDNLKKRKVMISPEQCRAARALLNWSQTDLAKAVKISKVSISAFEKGGDMRESNRKVVRDALEGAGVIFQADGEMITGGPGVRLKP